MKYLGVSVILMGALMVAGVASAQEAAPAAAKPEVEAAPAAPALPQPLELRKTGTISVTKDAAGKVTGIKLVVTSYEITLDEGSKELEGKDGKKVRVTGTFSMSPEGKRSFTVKSVESVAGDEVKAAPAAAAPAEAKPAEAAPAK